MLDKGIKQQYSRKLSNDSSREKVRKGLNGDPQG